MGSRGMRCRWCRPGTHRTLHPDLSAPRLDLLARQEEALRAHGFLPEAVDVRAWADPEPLRRARLLAPATRQRPSQPAP